jgi:hypothetical protein
VYTTWTIDTPGGASLVSVRISRKRAQLKSVIGWVALKGDRTELWMMSYA